MGNATDADEVQRIVAAKIKSLTRNGVKESSQRAALAKLRRGVGREPGETPEVWEVTLSNLPDSLASVDGTASSAEWAIHIALTLFALHVQGKNDAAEKAQSPGVSFGKAVRRLVDPDRVNEQAIKRRFDAALTAQNLISFSEHARGLVKLMKTKDVPLDYPVFAKQLYWYQDPYQKIRTMTIWGEDFWLFAKQKNEEISREDGQTKGENHEQ